MFAPPPSRAHGFRLISCELRTNNSYVYVASRGHSQKFILKFIHTEQGNMERARRECEIQNALQHPYIMPVADAFQCNEYFVLVMPRALGGPLSRVHRLSARTPQFTAAIAYRICLALERLHSEGIVHGDVKPDNVVLADLSTDDPKPLLIDFGHAAAVGCAGGRCGCHLMTAQYAAPELLNHEPHSFPVDVWALGATLFFLVTGEPLVRCVRDLKCMYQRAKSMCVRFDSPAWEEYPESIRGLVRAALEPDPERRCTVSEMLANPFFREVLGEEWIARERAEVDRSDELAGIEEGYEEVLENGFGCVY